MLAGSRGPVKQRAEGQQTHIGSARIESPLQGTRTRRRRFQEATRSVTGYTRSAGGSAYVFANLACSLFCKSTLPRVSADRPAIVAD